jgi:SAGA-associated factor 29
VFLLKSNQTNLSLVEGNKNQCLCNETTPSVGTGDETIGQFGTSTPTTFPRRQQHSNNTSEQLELYYQGLIYSKFALLEFLSNLGTTSNPIETPRPHSSPNMSARNRPRANHNQEADEERRLWKEIKDKAHEVDSMISRSNEIGNEILQTETQQAALLDANKPAEAALDRKLEELYRENLKLCEEVQHLIAGASSDMNVLDSINILAGLREASSAEQASAAAAPLGQRDRTASSKLSRSDRPKKSGSRGSNSAAVTEDGGDDSTAPSPRITLGQANRLSAKDKSSRAGSIPATRETSVKIEDGVESVASMDSAPSFSKGDSMPPGAGRLTSRVTFKAGETVFYRHKDKLLEGEGILCRVTAVIGEGKQRRYEIQDVDTDTTASTATGGKAPAVANPGATSSFRASISSLMQIPESNERLPDLPKGKQVFALYPETTTFYRGEVSASWRAKHDGGHVRVRFEGEMENIESQVVERRYVLLER